MQILILRHYPLVEGSSMRRYANNLRDGLRQRGYLVEDLTAPVLLGRIKMAKTLVKWFGYIDMFLIFPPFLILKVLLLPKSTLIVFMDQALAPWLHFIAGRKCVVHCHDLIAIDVAHGFYPYRHVSTLGKLYQSWILTSLLKAKYFISVSKYTQKRLESYIGNRKIFSYVLPNPLCIDPNKKDVSAETILDKYIPTLSNYKFLMHLGTPWYKNRMGLLYLWEELHFIGDPIHIVLIGALERDLVQWLNYRPHLKDWVYVIDYVNEDLLIALYALSAALIFPSYVEGFGWPILEAMACGCPVVTTNNEPMIEVGGDAIYTIDPMPFTLREREEWVNSSAKIIQSIINQPESARCQRRELGYKHTQYFTTGRWLDSLESMYEDIYSCNIF